MASQFPPIAELPPDADAAAITAKIEEIRATTNRMRPISTESVGIVSTDAGYVFRLINDDGSDNNEPGTPPGGGGDGTVTITCESWTAVPTLCGFSGYYTTGTRAAFAALSAGDRRLWEGFGKKWKKRGVDGQASFTACPNFANECNKVSDHVWSGVAEYNCVDGWLSYARRDGQYWNTFGWPCSVSSTDASTSVYGLTLGDGFGGGRPDLDYVCTEPFNLAYEVTATSLTSRTFAWCDFLNGCPDGTAEPGRKPVISGELTETLSDPDTIEDAIDRAATEPDDPPSCCAYTGDTNPMEWQPEAVDEMYFAESRRVTLTISLTGYAPSTTFLVTLFFSNSVLSTAAPLDDTSEVVEITTDGSGAAVVEFDIPQPDPDRARCYTSFTIGAV